MDEEEEFYDLAVFDEKYMRDVERAYQEQEGLEDDDSAAE